jgi:hypothetical protein
MGRGVITHSACTRRFKRAHLTVRTVRTVLCRSQAVSADCCARGDAMGTRARSLAAIPVLRSHRYFKCPKGTAGKPPNCVQCETGYPRNVLMPSVLRRVAPVRQCVRPRGLWGLLSQDVQRRRGAGGAVPAMPRRQKLHPRKGRTFAPYPHPPACVTGALGSMGD